MGASLLHLTQFASMAPAQFFIASLWQGLLLTAAAWFALKAFPLIGIRISPGTRFVLWMIVFILSAALPFSAMFEGRSLFAEPHKTGALFSAPHLPAIWAVAIVAVWALASLLSMARLLWNFYRLDMLARTSTPLPAEALSSELQTLLENSRSARQASRPVEICLSDRIDSPVVIGFFRPAVIIPRWLWRKLTPSEMSQIMMHELAHLERRDDWTNLLQKFLRALFPLNPALLLAERQLCWEREMACDDAVLDAAINPKEYATCLTSLAENKLLRRVQSLAPGAWQRHSELVDRVHRILAHKSAFRPRLLHSRAVIGAFLTIYLCAGVALARCPRLVAFTAIPGGQAMPTLNAESRHLDHGSRLLRTELRTAGVQGQNAPRLIDASFHTPASLSPVSAAQAPAAQRVARRNRSQRPAVPRRRIAARLDQPGLTQVRFMQSDWAEQQIAPARLVETRLMSSSPNSQRMTSSAIFQAMLAQAVVIQAAEQGAPQPAGAGSAVQLILYLSPLPGAGTSQLRANSPSNSSWIIIQL